MLKRSDYIILALTLFFFGVFIVLQYSSSKKYVNVIQPENNAVLALEVSKQTKVNASLRREAQDLTLDLENYKSSSISTKNAYDQYKSDIDRLGIITGEKPKSGQGVIIEINGAMTTPQIVDLINGIKNIGAEIISVNGNRLVLNTDLGQFSGLDHYTLRVLGNSNILKTALERKGGIVEQISTKDIKFDVEESKNVEISGGVPSRFIHSKIVN